MSKIEKALNRAREERANLPVLVPGAGAGATPAAGTALVAERVGPTVSAETIGRMSVSESRLLTPGDLAQRGIIQREHTEDPTVQVFRELRTKIIQQTQGLKSPNVHRLIGSASVPGLTDYLENPDLDIAKIIRPVGIARYRAIAAGKRRDIPAEYFTSVRMKRLIDSVRRRYQERFIILDGPPMSDIADTRILAELCDYVLVVARYGRATNAQIERCLNAISDKKLLGVVFNDEPRIPWTR